MNIQNNFTREEIAESLHTDFGLTKKDCIIFLQKVLDSRHNLLYTVMATKGKSS